MAPRPGSFVWHDLATADPGGAEHFYTSVMGWGIQPFEMIPTYRMWVAGDGPIGGVSQLEEGTVPGWLGYVSVEDADAAAARVRELGGRVLVEPTDIPNGGRFTVFSDPQGAVLAAYQSSPDGWTPPADPPVGEFSWRELATPDPEAALDFYGQLFGWGRAAEVHDMGDAGPYWMFTLDGKLHGGMYVAKEQSPAWLHYVRVADLEGAVGRVVELGGTLVVEPMEVPGGDRVAIGLDAQGIQFALHQTRGA